MACMILSQIPKQALPPTPIAPLSHNPLSNPPLKRRKRASSVHPNPSPLRLEAMGCFFFQPLHLSGLYALSCAGLEVPDPKDAGGGEEGDAQEDAE